MLAESKVRSRHVGMLAEQIGEKANRISHACAIDRRQPIRLPGLSSLIGCGRQSELQIRSIRLNPDGLAPGIQGGVVSSSVQQNLGQPIQGADKLRVDCERLAKLGFRTGRVRQHRAEGAACLQQPWIILHSQLELPDRGVGLLLTLPHQPEIKMRFGRVRIQLQGLFEGRDGTFEIVFLGEPDAYGVVNSGGWRARRRMSGRCWGFAAGRQLGVASCSEQEQEQESATAGKRPA